MKKLNNEGVAIFITLTLLFLLSVGAIVVLLTAYNYSNVTENQIRRSQALSVAEGGIHYAYWKIRIGKDDDGNDVDFGDGSTHTLTPPMSMPQGYSLQVDITHDIATGRKTIESKTTY